MQYMRFGAVCLVCPTFFFILDLVVFFLPRFIGDRSIFINGYLGSGYLSFYCFLLDFVVVIYVRFLTIGPILCIWVICLALLFC